MKLGLDNEKMENEVSNEPISNRTRNEGAACLYLAK
jgi:hypothetical protein